MTAWHPSAKLALLMANVAACRSGAREIEPAHLSAAILGIVDENWQQQAVWLDFGPEEMQEIREVVPFARELFELSDSDLTAVRRRLHRLLAHSVSDVRMQSLHRSSAVRRLWDNAIRQAEQEGAPGVTVVHLLQELLKDPPQELVDCIGRAGPGHEAKQSETAPEVGVFGGLGRDLTGLARGGRLRPLVGRRKELKTLLRLLSRATKPNVLLIGDAGVGKTALVEGLAGLLAGGAAPESLADSRIVEISVGELLSGTRYRGDLEERVSRLIEEASRDPGLIVFFDEVHLLTQRTSTDDPVDVANLLKSALTREDLRFIGATTTDEYERFVKRDPAFTRRFQVLRLQAPDEQEAVAIVGEWARRIAEIQDVEFTADVVESAVMLAARHLRERALPDSAIDLLDTAAAYVRIPTLSLSAAAPSKTPLVVSQEHLRQVLCEHYGLASLVEPVAGQQLVARLSESVVGQERAIRQVAMALQAADSRRESAVARPRCVVLLAGPTGVGKTLMAEKLAEHLYGSQAALGRFNMSEYHEAGQLSRLIGAAPGFVGHGESGALWRYLERHSEGLILLDEIDKADQALLDFFLEVFDKGVARDSKGRERAFNDYVFVLTCNERSKGAAPLGFAPHARESDGEQTRDASRALAFLRAEFRARLDAVVFLDDLDERARAVLLRRYLDECRAAWDRQHGLQVDASEDVLRLLLELSAAASEGARGLRKLVEQYVGRPVAESAAAHRGCGSLQLVVRDGRVVVQS